MELASDGSSPCAHLLYPSACQCYGSCKPGCCGFRDADGYSIRRLIEEFVDEGNVYMSTSFSVNSNGELQTPCRLLFQAMKSAKKKCHTNDFAFLANNSPKKAGVVFLGDAPTGTPSHLDRSLAWNVAFARKQAVMPDFEF